MNRFEHELRMLIGDCAALKDTKFIDRVCYVDGKGAGSRNEDVKHAKENPYRTRHFFLR